MEAFFADLRCLAGAVFFGTLSVVRLRLSQLFSEEKERSRHR